MIVHILFIIFGGILILELYVRFNRNGRLINKIPGALQLPLAGNLLSYDITSRAKMWKAFRIVSNIYYPITRIWVGPRPYICIRHPDDLEIFLSSQKAITKSDMYDYFRPLLKNGLVTSSGDLWHQRRKLLTPSFHFNILKKYSETIFQQSETMIQELRSENKESVEVLFPLCSKITLRVICESAMGVALNKMDPKIANNYVEAIHKTSSVAMRRMAQPYITDFMMKIFPFMSYARDLNKYLPILDKFTDEIIEKRRKYHDRTNGQYLKSLDDDAVDDTYMGRKKKLAMLDHLIMLERDGLIDNEGIKEEVDTFCAAGHDTTAASMLFTLMLLAENKDAQKQARAEVTDIMNKNKGKLTSNDLQEMSYLERCIKESMRLYSPVPTIARYVEEDIQLKHALVPANSNVILFIYDTHRDPNFWEKPEIFNPDRFLFENTKNRHPFAYVPFSAGPRNCIGQRFAMNELKSLLAHILYNFHLEPVDLLADIEFVFDLVLQPTKPVKLKFIQIDNRNNTL